MEVSGDIDETKILADFKTLSPEQRKEAANFIAFLKIREEIDATNEIPADEVFVKAILKGETDLKEGRAKPWSEVFEDV